MSAAKYWCFTLNNPTDDEVTRIEDAPSLKDVAYLVYGRERGEEGTYHLQGYIEFAKKKRLAYIKKLLSTRLHLEVRRGSQEQAITYCKKDGNIFEGGEPILSQQGRRRDLEAIRDDIKSGVTELEIAEGAFSQWVTYRRSFERYRELCNGPRHRTELEVILLWGSSGTGKSSFVYSQFPECWISTNPVLKWFDGYNGQATALIDDFTGECPFRLLLRLLDVYPIRVEIKGGHQAWNPSRIFITSNKPIDEWYGGEKDTTPLQRRIKKVYHMDTIGKTVPDRHEYLKSALNLPLQ